MGNINLAMTESERLLEDILNKYGIAYERIPESDIENEKTPDYLVLVNDLKSYWEVKELVPNEAEEAISKSVENGDGKIYSVNSRRIRNSIKSACEQFKNYGVTDSPCVVVVYDARPFETRDLLFYSELKAVMLGNAEFMVVNDGSFKEISRKDALFNRNGKTYVSAIVVIHKHSKEVVMFHNPNAKFSLIETEIKNILNHHEIATFTKTGVVWNRL